VRGKRSRWRRIAQLGACPSGSILFSRLGRWRLPWGIVAGTRIAVETTIPVSATAAKATVAISTAATEAAAIAAAKAALATVTEAWSAIAISARPAITRLTHTFGEGEQRQVPGTLDRDRQRALMLGAGASLAAWLDHAALRDEATHTRHVLVVDVLDAIDAEAADLATRERATATTAAKPATWALAISARTSLT
jgi:hypothetical protein